VLYPYINAPSVLVALSQQGYDKYCPDSRENSLIIIDEDLVKHSETRKDRLHTIPALRIAEELGRTTVANVVMLGFLAAVTGIVSIEALQKAVKDSVPEAMVELNLKALERGYNYTQEKAKA